MLAWFCWIKTGRNIQTQNQFCDSVFDRTNFLEFFALSCGGKILLLWFWHSACGVLKVFGHLKYSILSRDWIITQSIRQNSESSARVSGQVDATGRRHSSWDSRVTRSRCTTFSCCCSSLLRRVRTALVSRFFLMAIWISLFCLGGGLCVDLVNVAAE